MQGVKRFPIKRRDNYIENDLYQLVYSHAEQQIKDLMDIAYLTGQRPIDIVGLRRDNIHDGHLHIQQRKTKAKLRFELTGDLMHGGFYFRIHSYHFCLHAIWYHVLCCLPQYFHQFSDANRN